jgi:hypothetical protein
MQHAGTTVDNRASAAISCRNVDERAIELLSIRNTWHQTQPGFRSLRLHRFPYVLHYRLEGMKIVVFAIMFGGRDPSAWQDRL